MKRILNALQPADRSHRFFPSGSSILIALSGGPDSVALALIIKSLANNRRIRLAAAHINHGLRPEADRDESWVRRWCDQQGIECFTDRVAKRLKARLNTESIEEAARRVRYDALVGLMVKNGFSRLATAHTADDQAETVLMRLGTGSGLAGLAGIPAVRIERGITVIRPLLQISKSDLLEFLKRKKITFLRDRSNASKRFLRNRIRLKLLPDLRSLLNPRIDEHLADLASDAASWRAWSETWAKQFIKKYIYKTRRELIVRVDELSACPEPLRVAVYFKIAEMLTGQDQHLRREHIRQIESLVAGSTAGERILACDVRIRRYPTTDGDRIAWRSNRLR